jgi:predicted Fe-Mo cluster-binding NifX family protein
MKIAVPVLEKNIKMEVSPSFGRAPYFAMYDTESKTLVYEDNEAAMSQGGAGIKAAQFLVDAKVDTLLTPRCGKNAADVLEAASVLMYQTQDLSVSQNIELFEKNELSLLTKIHAGFHNHGGNE